MLSIPFDTAILVAAIGFVGVLIGQFVAVFLGSRYAAEVQARAQKTVAQINAESARVLSRDKDRRDWRKQRVAPLLAKANERIGLWMKYSRGDLSSSAGRALSVSFAVENTSYFGIDDDALQQAFQDLVDADSVCSEKIFLVQPLDKESTPAIAQLSTAVTKLNNAAEEYIHRV